MTWISEKIGLLKRSNHGRPTTKKGPVIEQRKIEMPLILNRSVVKEIQKKKKKKMVGFKDNSLS
jgi:hypothetical protein